MENETWYCDLPFQDINSFLFVVETIITVIGFVGNATTFVVILKESKQCSTSYIVIGCLTISDFAALILRYLQTWKFAIFPIERNSAYVIPINIIAATALATEVNSTLHVTLLVVTRYCLIGHPLWSRRFVSKRICLYMSAGIWIFSLIVGSLYFWMYCSFDYRYIDRVIFEISELSVFVLLIGVPCTMMIVFHILTVRKLKNSKSRNTQEATRKLTFLTGFIFTVQIISQGPWFIFSIINFINVTWIDCVLKTFAVISSICLIINHSANPLIYFLMTPVARQLCLYWIYSVRQKWTRRRDINTTVHLEMTSSNSRTRIDR